MNKRQIKQILLNKGLIKDENKSKYSVKCCFHSEKNGQSLFIDFDRGTFKCFSGKCPDKKGTLLQLCELLGENITDSYVYKPITGMVLKFPVAVEKEEKVLQEFDLANYQKWHKLDYKYLIDRNISADICKQNQCSYSDYLKRFYIPFWQDDRCYGIVGRSTLTRQAVLQFLMKFCNEIGYTGSIEELEKDIIDGEYHDLDSSGFIRRTQWWKRYKNSVGLNKDSLVFCPRSNKKDAGVCLVVEGQINALYANCVGLNAVSILGSYPSVIQVEKIMQLVKNMKLILAFDNDVAGVNNTHVFRQKCGKIVARIDWNKLGRKVGDLNDLNRDELIYLVENCTYM